MKQLITFTKLELLNLFDFNVYRHVKDPREKRKRTAIWFVIIFIVLFFSLYLAASAYALSMLGVGKKIPMVYSVFSSVIVLMFGAFKAKAYFYREKDLTSLASLPVKSAPIIAARLIHSYAENVFINGAVILPPFLICGLYEKPGTAFYWNMVLAFLILPILPTALTAWFGILVAAIVSRNRHKVLTETIFALVLGVGGLFLPFLLMPQNAQEPIHLDFSGDTTSAEMTKTLSVQITKAFENMEVSFPISKIWGSFFLGENIGGFLLYGLCSLVFFALTALLIGQNFFSLTAKLFPQKEHREFHLTAMRSGSITSALIQKEARRYASCGIYVTNTIIGPVFAVCFAVTLGFVDLQELFSTAKNMPVDLNPQAGIPFLIGAAFSIMTITASSVSMEGKNVWIIKNLPLPAKDMINAKLLFNLLFLAPFYVLTEIILLFTAHVNLLERLWLLLVPAVLILFSVTFGLFMNLKFPKYQWESPGEVVKQSAAAGLSMLAMFAALIPGIGMMTVPSGLRHAITLGLVAIICCATLLIYRKCLKSSL